MAARWWYGEQTNRLFTVPQLRTSHPETSLGLERRQSDHRGKLTDHCDDSIESQPLAESSNNSADLEQRPCSVAVVLPVLTVVSTDIRKRARNRVLPG